MLSTPRLCWKMAYNVGKVLALSALVVAGSLDILADWMDFLPDFFGVLVSAVGIVVMDYIFRNIDPVSEQKIAARERDVVAAGHQGFINNIFVSAPGLIS